MCLKVGESSLVCQRQTKIASQQKEKGLLLDLITEMRRQY